MASGMAPPEMAWLSDNGGGCDAAETFPLAGPGLNRLPLPEQPAGHAMAESFARTIKHHYAKPAPGSDAKTVMRLIAEGIAA